MKTNNLIIFGITMITLAMALPAFAGSNDKDPLKVNGDSSQNGVNSVRTVATRASKADKFITELNDWFSLVGQQIKVIFEQIDPRDANNPMRVGEFRAYKGRHIQIIRELRGLNHEQREKYYQELREWNAKREREAEERGKEWHAHNDRLAEIERAAVATQSEKALSSASQGATVENTPASSAGSADAK